MPVNDTTRSPEEEVLPEQKEMKKFSTWAAVIGGSIIAAYAQSIPAKEFGEAFTLPTELVIILITILLMLLVTTGNRRVTVFTLKRTLVLLALSVILFLLNSGLTGWLAVRSINPPFQLKGIGPRSFSLTPDAAAAIAKDVGHRYENETVLLSDFHYDPRLVWTETSLTMASATLYFLYIVGTLTLAVTLIGAFNVYKMQNATQPRAIREPPKASRDDDEVPMQVS